MYDNGLLVHDLTGRVSEGRQGQGDSLHLPLTHFLLMLLFQVLPPVRKRKHSDCAQLTLPKPEQELALVTANHLTKPGLTLASPSSWPP